MSENAAVAEGLPAADRSIQDVTERDVELSVVPRHRRLRRSSDPDDAFREIPYTRLGQSIFRTIVALVVGFAVVLLIFGFISYPQLSDIRALSPSASAADVAKSYEDARTAWVNQMTTLGQLFLFGSIIPLLATVVGYLLGDKRGQGGS